MARLGGGEVEEGQHSLDGRYRGEEEEEELQRIEREEEEEEWRQMERKKPRGGICLYQCG